ncbi:MAG: diaminopropionate ammonia-lyase [Firmicutes bacterium]|nr:diaminopropionate ammonia-lyase [Bacillota bacterium]
MHEKPARWTMNDLPGKKHLKPMPGFALDDKIIESVMRYHSGLPGYCMTPLQPLKALASSLGLGGIWVKDESRRFGLNAFKGLGGSYAIARLLGRELGIEEDRINYRSLKEAALRNKSATFVTATDGNHGRGVAWAARILGQKAVVFMPKGSSKSRIDAISGEGADVFVTEVNYDDSVRIAASYSADRGFFVVQDQAWEGYEEVPTWIMHGYLTIMQEIMEQLKASGDGMPTHVLLQAGVGSFAGSMIAYLEHAMGEDMPKVVLMEPDKADCLYESAKSEDGAIVDVKGSLDTIMAGLACGEPNPIAWGVTRGRASAFVSCDDEVAALGMRVLGNPLDGDPRVISGESGAVGAGLIKLMANGGSLSGLGEQLGLGASSKVLMISTEGDTDPDRYRKIVWEGAWPNSRA